MSFEADITSIRKMMETDLTEHIRKVGDHWEVMSKDGKKKLGGPYSSREKAAKRLREIEYFKHQNEAKSYDFHPAQLESEPKDLGIACTKCKKITEFEHMRACVNCWEGFCPDCCSPYKNTHICNDCLNKLQGNVMEAGKIFRPATPEQIEGRPKEKDIYLVMNFPDYNNNIQMGVGPTEKFESLDKAIEYARHLVDSGEVFVEIIGVPSHETLWIGGTGWQSRRYVNDNGYVNINYLPKNAQQGSIGEATRIFKPATPEQRLSRPVPPPLYSIWIGNYLVWVNFDKAYAIDKAKDLARKHLGVEVYEVPDGKSAFKKASYVRIYPAMTEAAPKKIFKAATPEQIAGRPSPTQNKLDRPIQRLPRPLKLKSMQFVVIYKGDRDDPADYDNFTYNKEYVAMGATTDDDLNLGSASIVMEDDDPNAYIMVRNDVGEIIAMPTIDFDFEDVNEAKRIFKSATPAEISNRPKPEPPESKFKPSLGKHVELIYRPVGYSPQTYTGVVEWAEHLGEYVLLVDDWDGRMLHVLSDSDEVVREIPLA